MNEMPDLYTDGFMLGASPYGLTLTFTLTEPPATAVSGPQEIPSHPVMRVRLSRQLGETLIEHLSQALKAGGQPQMISTVKH